MSALESKSRADLMITAILPILLTRFLKNDKIYIVSKFVVYRYKTKGEFYEKIYYYNFTS